MYWESSIEELRRRTSIDDLRAANTLAGRLLENGFNNELVVTNIAQMIAEPDYSAHEPYWGWNMMRIIYSLGPTLSSFHSSKNWRE